MLPVAACFGYKLALDGLQGRVHSVFDNACNVATDRGLVTLAHARLPRGPTTISLAGWPPHEFPALFAVGDVVRAEAGLLHAGAKTVCQFVAATRWLRPPRPVLRPGLLTAARLAALEQRVAALRADRSSVIDRAGAPVLDALGVASRDLDPCAAAAAIHRLIGWGEGLTPAGDDVLVGWLAGLDLLAASPAQRAFFDACGAAVRALAHATTPISAHYLQMATEGDLIEPLTTLRTALATVPAHGAVMVALDRALAVGATSGADAVTGLLLALHAWAPAEAEVA